jgi:hypothetical protein
MELNLHRKGGSEHTTGHDITIIIIIIIVYVMAHLFIYLFLSRGLEIRTLRYFVETAESSFVLRDYSKANIAVKEMSGDFTLHFNSYKTCKTMGHDQVTVEVSVLVIHN